MIPEKKIEIPTSDYYPTCCLVIGMAGSGKTTFIHQLEKQSTTRTQNKVPYIVNLDPAVSHIPYTPFYDIRDKIKIKDVMKDYNLGPNGGILTSLNLFATQFDQVCDKMEAQRDITDIYVVDTPGQIEVFSWSASGSIITQMLASSFPTVIVYVVDLSRCQNPNSFMSNMLFCCSILFKLRLPMVVAFNKSDVSDPEQVKKWLKDCISYSDDLRQTDSYLSSLSRSLAFALDEFYGDLNCVYLSSKTGAGFDDLFKALERGRDEYFKIFLPDLEKQIEKNKGDTKMINKHLKKFQEQLNQDKKTDKVETEIKEETEVKEIKKEVVKPEGDKEINEVKKKFEEFKIEEEK